MPSNSFPYPLSGGKGHWATIRESTRCSSPHPLTPGFDYPMFCSTYSKWLSPKVTGANSQRKVQNLPLQLEFDLDMASMLHIIFWRISGAAIRTPLLPHLSHNDPEYTSIWQRRQLHSALAPRRKRRLAFKQPRDGFTGCNVS